MKFRLVLPSVVMAGVVVACAGCAASVTGTPRAVPIPVESASEVSHQAILNLSEAGVLHLKGKLTTKDNDELDIDFLTTSSGELTGTIGLDGQQAQAADLGGRLYLNASQAFWTAIADLPSGSDSAAAGNWVTVPTDLLGVDPISELTPAAIGNSLSSTLPKTDNRGFTSLGTTEVNGTKAVQFDANQDSTGDMLVDADAPHGILHADFEVGGGNALVVDISDASATAPAVYQTLSQQAGALQTAIDPNLDVTQGTQTWGTCNGGGCSVNVTFTNSSSVTTKVLVTGNWTGDNNPVGSCQAISDPVAAGANGTATCTVNTPEWAAFYHRAQTVPGDHPYELRWAAFALAEPPNQQTINAEQTEASTPAKASNPTGDTSAASGGEYVYRIDYQDQSSHTQVWKYGVTNVGSWQNYASAQAGQCLAERKTSCSVSLVGRVPNLVSAQALAVRLVGTATAAQGKHCPPGQWAFCA
ncbi:MAG TPA: hypothetical protein VHZ97_06200 [Pseudonocardiaceae bacterium]|jgi:hypothetical protein|nr:hypothetical protein [Pseudonocardiaceae bacterium]